MFDQNVILKIFLCDFLELIVKSPHWYISPGGRYGARPFRFYQLPLKAIGYTLVIWHGLYYGNISPLGVLVGVSVHQRVVGYYKSMHLCTCVHVVISLMLDMRESA